MPKVLVLQLNICLQLHILMYTMMIDRMMIAIYLGLESLDVMSNVICNKSRNEIVAVIISVLEPNIPFRGATKFLNHLLQVLDFKLCVQKSVRGTLDKKKKRRGLDKLCPTLLK